MLYIILCNIVVNNILNKIYFKIYIQLYSACKLLTCIDIYVCIKTYDIFISIYAIVQQLNFIIHNIWSITYPPSFKQICIIW